MTGVVVVAAGKGRRLGGALPKAFCEVAGAPLVLHAVRALAPAAAAVVVVIADGWQEQAAAVVRGVRDARDAPPHLVAGGATRAASVAAGLAALPREVEVVAVHDAARPLVTAALLQRCVAALDGVDATAPAVPITDTLKRTTADDLVEATVDRAALRAVQTPQVFRTAHLRALHAGADPGVTDDLQLVEQAGGRVRLVPGDPRNLKVTWPEDLAVVAVLLAAAAP